MSDIKTINKINDWKIEPSRHYTENDLIDAYLRGKEVGMNIEKKVMLEKFQQNLIIATNEGTILFNILDEYNIKCNQCFLKVESTISFEIIYLIDSSNYTEDNLDKIYSNSRKKKSEINNDTFYINFSFIPDDGNLNEKRLISDGYILKYNRKD